MKFMWFIKFFPVSLSSVWYEDLDTRIWYTLKYTDFLCIVLFEDMYSKSRLYGCP